ncbi:MAG: Rne/Rng family ribonuclease [Pseudomonadota bacterium]
MTKKMLIDATHAEETRVVVLDGNKVDEFDFESLYRKQLAGNIYLAKVTRVEPSLQAAFVDYGGNRHGFLAFSEIHPDYYQIPKADREALLAEEAALARQSDDETEKQESEPKPTRGKSRTRKRSIAAADGAGTTSGSVLKSDEVLAETTLKPADEGSGDAANDGSQGDSEQVVTREADVTIGETEGDGATDATVSDGEADEASSVESREPDVSDASNEAELLAEQTAPSGQDDPSDQNEGSPIDIPAQDLASSELATTSDEEARSNASEEGETDYESFGGQEALRDEQPARRPRPRRYKIQEVIKVRQILLVQVIKEERGNKGAALTTYLSLAGRYCVLMPNTARGGGISRKITNATDRKKLKDISSSITVPEGAGLIIRTAGANRTKTEIRRDYEFLLRQWEQIRDLTLESIAPCLIYEEGSLVKRAIRDLYSRDIEEVLVDGERGYREAKDYMKMLMPSHAKNVKHYADPLPLFSRFQVESYLGGMFNPVVQLKSGGYIVIDVTEALVAVDVNSGRATREASIEETALKTNLEAAEEAARQMRLRDLAGLIVIDFIDMDERKNNSAVEKRLKDKLKTDRARIQVGRISAFGLLEMIRQRLRPGMIEATTKSCPHCHGTGRVRSDDSVALALLREVEEEGVRQRSKEVLVVAPVDITNYLLNYKREHVSLIESRFGLSIRVEGDASLVSPEYKIERFKTASRMLPSFEGVPVSNFAADAESAKQVASPETVPVDAEAVESDVEEDKSQPKKKRRRRRRGGAKSHREGQDLQISERSTSPVSVDTDLPDMEENSDLDAVTHALDGERSPESESSLEGTVESHSSDETEGRSSASKIAPDKIGNTEMDSAFGEVIDIDPGSPAEIVHVPETEAGQKPRRRPRVSQSAASVIAEVAIPSSDPAEEQEQEHDQVDTVDDRPAGLEATASPQTLEHNIDADLSETSAEELEESTTASQVEEDGVSSELQPEDPKELIAAADLAEAAITSETDPTLSVDAPKRRGWWSRDGSSGG